MTTDIISTTETKKLFMAVARQIQQGTLRAQQAFKTEVLRTAWNIGRAIVETVDLDEGISSRNARIVVDLARQFGRPQTFFYSTIKLYRFYPVFPKTGLSWSHYQDLLRIDDSVTRRQLEQKAVKESISNKDFRIIAREARGTLTLAQPLAQNGILHMVRGQLYHYRVKQATPEQLEKKRLLLDVGFGIDRDVRLPDTESLRAGRMVRAVKEGEDYTAKISPYETDRLYTYKAKVTRVIDGDTLEAIVNMGFRTYITHVMRLRGIDAPEITCALGRKAKNFVQQIVDTNPTVVIKTYKQEKYGRYLADVFTGSKDMDAAIVAQRGEYLNQRLLDEGLAVLMEYK